MTSRRLALRTTTVAAILLIAACGSSDDPDTTQTATETTGSAPPDSTPPTAGSWCDEQGKVFFANPFPAASEASLTSYSEAFRAALAVPFAGESGLEPITEVGSIDAAGEAAIALLDEVDALVQSGSVQSAVELADQVDDLIVHRFAAVAVAGQECAIFRPSQAENSTAIPLLAGWQIGAGFGSLWVAREFTNEVVRVDPASGEVLATVDVGGLAFKLQPADGRMWVRTTDSYVAIDPVTNEISTVLAKADVGLGANRAWAVDGALWICDGDTLHRYNPADAQPLAEIALDFECGQVYATNDLAVAYTYNEVDGESNASMAALIDPATNSVTHTVPLPIDGLVPVVLDGVVYMPGNLSDKAVTIDRATGEVSEAPSALRTIRGSQSAADGEFIYLPAKDYDEIIVVDATTFEVSDTIPTLGVNSLQVVDGTLWTANNVSGFVQGFTR